MAHLCVNNLDLFSNKWAGNDWRNWWKLTSGITFVPLNDQYYSWWCNGYSGTSCHQNKNWPGWLYSYNQYIHGFSYFHLNGGTALINRHLSTVATSPLNAVTIEALSIQYNTPKCKHFTISIVDRFFGDTSTWTVQKSLDNAGAHMPVRFNNWTLPYSGKFSLVQNFAEMCPDLP